MKDRIEKLKAEIANLEILIQKDHFRSLIDKARSEQNYHRLKKLKKELKDLEKEAGKKE